MASGKACHHVAAAKTRRKYNPAKIADDPGLQVHLWANHADAARYGESIHRSFFSAQTENHYPGQGQLAIAKFTFVHPHHQYRRSLDRQSTPVQMCATPHIVMGMPSKSGPVRWLFLMTSDFFDKQWVISLVLYEEFHLSAGV